MYQSSCDADASKSLSAPTTIFSYQLINMLMVEEKRPRLSAAERREQMLDAATLVFG